jgi:hypothetical protein
VTPDGYRAAVRLLGLTPYRQSHGGNTLHQTRDGAFMLVPDPEPYSPEERAAIIEALRWRLGIIT